MWYRKHTKGKMDAAASIFSFSYVSMETSSIMDEICESIRSVNRVVGSAAKAAEASAVVYTTTAKVEVVGMLVETRKALGLPEDTPLPEVARILEESWQVIR